MKLHRSLVAAALALGLGAPALQAETLADALAYAYEHSGLLEQNRALLRAADEDVAQAAAKLMPVVNWSATVTSTFNNVQGFNDPTSEIGLSASLSLYDGGRNRMAIEQQKEIVLATREQLLGIEQQVLLGAVQAYVNVNQAAEVVSISENNVRVLTQERRASQDQFDVGEVTRTDVALADSSLAAAKSQLASAQGNLAIAIESYRAAVGRRPGQLATAPTASVTRSIEDAKAFAMRNHPTILGVQHQIAANEIGVKRAQAAVIPSVTLQGQVGVDQDFNQGGSISLSVGGPVYQGGALDSVVRQAMAQRDAARSNLLVQSQSIAQSVGTAYANLSVARASIQASQQQVSAARIAFEGVREEASLGSRTTLDVLNAEQDQLNAQSALIQARANEVVASYSVLASMGLLTAQNLNLRVQLYDASAYYNLVKDAPVARSAQGRALDRVLQAIGKQ